MLAQLDEQSDDCRDDNRAEEDRQAASYAHAK
jgi:hypothetical protein